MDTSKESTDFRSSIEGLADRMGAGIETFSSPEKESWSVLFRLPSGMSIALCQRSASVYEGDDALVRAQSDLTEHPWTPLESYQALCQKIDPIKSTFERITSGFSE